MNVLWGRVVVLGVVLLLVFLLGRATGGNTAELEALQDRVEAQNAEIDQLTAENRELANAAASPPPPTGGEGTGDGTGASPTASPTATGTASPSRTVSPSPGGTATPTTGATGTQNYTIRPGDSLRAIANRFYGNATYAKCIQTANNIADPSKLQSGKSLIIPPKPAQPCT